MRLFGKISSNAGNLKVVELRRLCLFWVYSQTCVQRSPLGNDKVMMIQGDRYIQLNFAENYKTTENFGKSSGDRNIQGDCSYKAVYTGLIVSYFKVLRPWLFRVQL